MIAAQERTAGAQADSAATLGSDGKAALDHLLRHVLTGITIAEHIRLAAATDDGRSVRLLAMLGLRYCANERALAVARDLPADDVFLWSQWAESHEVALMTLPGARRACIWIGGKPTSAVLIPADLCGQP
tara:strand:- start:1500 stop:1889 length:390 start_codon:yes stop_codon:yes gene_type:complete